MPSSQPSQPLQIKNAVERFDFPDAELIIGVVCAVGADYSPVRDSIQGILGRHGYATHVIKISDLIGRFTDDTLPESPEVLRISRRMDAGNAACRAKLRKDLWALAVIAEINAKRRQKTALKRTAHVVLSLKRPEEVATLRKVYGDGFFLVGVFATEQERLHFLIERNAPKQDALALIKRDEEEPANEFGQHTADTFQLSDVFVQLKNEAFKDELRRFFKLVFSDPYVTPTQPEHAMFLAYAAALRSGQLGRQVGAAISSRKGDVLAVGCNDVPKPGGGLYWPGRFDNRDNVLGEDTNDKQRDRLISQLLSTVKNADEKRVAAIRKWAAEALGHWKAEEQERTDFVERLTKSTAEFDRRQVEELWPAFRSTLDITEYGRAVHAEMDALLTCARSGVSPKGSILYTTTFPCHNCTRHIIAAGIERVFYIEPYAKSKAEELHEDAITVEERAFGKESKGIRRVPFTHFVGVGPRRYFDLFSMTLSSGYELIRKRSGRTIPVPEPNAWPRIPLSPFSYLDKEEIAVHMLDELYNQQQELDILGPQT